MTGKLIQKIVYLFVISGLISGFSSNASSQAKLPSSPIKTIYITPTSHYDFGFVDPPDAIRERAARHIDEVIRVAEANPRFKWTIESVWQINEWLKRQKTPASVLPKDKQKINRLMNLIKSGRIMLSTSWGSMHTDFMGSEEINRLMYDYAQLERTYGVKSEMALMDDVPGHPTTIPSVLAGSGTKYLLVGANCFINNATSLAPGKVPFYWQAPDGSKVLLWVSQGKRGGYVEGLTDFYLDPYTLDPYTDRTPFDMFNPTLIGKKTPMEIMEIGVTEFLNRYNGGGYKYDAAMAIYAHDFLEPTSVLNLEKAVNQWNLKHKEIQLKIATPIEFLKYIETKYGSQIPTYKGEWSGLWSEAKTVSPRFSAAARYVQNQTPAAETLWSAITMTRNIPHPVGNFSSLYDWMMTYDEHSGAGNTGWIQLNFRAPLEEQNRQYGVLLSKAKHEVDYMNKKGLSLLAQPSRHDNIQPQKSTRAWNLMVYNPLSWNRNDLVKVNPPQENLRVTEVKDLSANQKVDFDIDEQGQVIFVAGNVPAMGYKSFEISAEPGANVTTLKSDENDRDFSGQNFSVKVRPDGTIESIRDLRLNRELVNNNGEVPFNDLLKTEGPEAAKVVYPIAPKITVKNGSQMTQIQIRRERSVFPETVISIFEGLDRVEIRNELATDLPFPGGNGNWDDSYYFAFPFNVSKDNLKVKRGGQKWFDTLPDDYLPGARTDSVTTRNLIGMTDGSSSALLAHRQAFHFVYSSYVATRVKEPGAPKDFLPALYMGKFPLPEATLYSRAIRRNNQADTHDLGVVNLETLEPGFTSNHVYEYAVAADGRFDDLRAWRLGADFNLPLRAEFVPVLPKNQVLSFFSVNQPNVQIVNVKAVSGNVTHGEVGATPLNPQINKVFVVRLQEFTGKSVSAQINLPVKIKTAAIVTLTEDKILQNVSQISPLTIGLKPFETKTIKIEID